MFEALGRFAIRFRWIIVVFWVLAAVVGARVLPSLASVSSSSNAQFLPANAPSQLAAGLAAPFQSANPGATALIVAVRSRGSLTPSDDAAIGRLEQAATSVPGVTIVRDQGTSADGQARSALVVASAATQGSAGDSIVKQVRQKFGTVDAPPGLALHLTGPLAQATDSAASTSQAGSNIRVFTVLFVIALLFVVYRSALAPLATLLPAVLSLALSGGLIATAAQAGLPVSPATQLLLPVLLLGAGADYGLFLVFRVREEVRNGASHHDAIVTAMGRVGESITFSAATVIVALCCLLLASFGIYRGLGPSLAIGVAVILLAALTLLPALLSIVGRAVFWPSHPAPGQQPTSLLGRLAERVVHRPVPVLLAAIVLFGALAAGLAGFRTGGFTSNSSTPASDSAAGSDALASHFPAASSTAESLLLSYATPVWTHIDDLTVAQQRLGSNPSLSAVSGPLDPNGTAITASGLSDLRGRLGPAQALPPAPPAGSTVTPATYRAYRATAQFISPDGRTVRFYALPSGGQPGSHAAVNSMPSLRTAIADAARATGAVDSGVLAQDAAAYDIDQYSTSDLLVVVPVALLAIALLLAVLLRSVVAPVYLVATVGFSYLAALGFATILFIRIGGQDGLIFIIPILLFIFAMALGEDYNILLMTRVREEAHSLPVRDALTRAVGRTGGTITSAGLILAGTFAVLGIAGNSEQARELGFTIGFAVLLDTFFVRTLLVPSIAVLLGRWNWWPSNLSG